MNILIIDDEKNIGITLKNILEDNPQDRCDFVLSSKEAENILHKQIYDIVLLDVKLPDKNGLELLKTIKEKYKDTVVIMISGHSGIREAVEAIKNGAFDFLEKPLSLQRVKLTIQNAKKYISLNKINENFKKELDDKYKIVGNSKEIIRIKELISRVAKTDSKVLILGESGTGKELVAYAIHNQSRRKDKPFIKFNSAAIPSELVESELFGYEKGAFTGAIKTKKGKLEDADGGTLFLDEIGDMNIDAQAKILRVLQDGEFERVGGNRTIKVDIRVIAATHRDLEKMIKEGTFRHDLFYRLNVLPIKIPPLRERKDDILVLSEYFLKKYAIEMNLPEKKLSKGAIKKLMAYPFKGNVRELKNMIERLYIIYDKPIITDEDLQLSVDKDFNEQFWLETKSFRDKRAEFERKYLEIQLKKFNCNLSQTATAIDMQVSNLSRKLKELKIDCQKNNI